MRWFKEFIGRITAEPNVGPRLKPKHSVEAEPVKMPTPKIGEEIKCFVATFLKQPRRFGITKDRHRPRRIHCPFEIQFTDRVLGKTWHVKYMSSQYEYDAWVRVEGLELTSAESAYLVGAVAKWYTQRYWRLTRLKADRKTRQSHTQRRVLHKLYCEGDSCVASCK